MRLNKFISETGYCSRREADQLIHEGRVTVNGQQPELGTRVLPGDAVKVNGKLISGSARKTGPAVYIAYHKPVGITCTTEQSVEGNIIDAIRHPRRIFPIGRLDKPSEGLILLTSDGDIVNRILRAENAHEKEYLVQTHQELDARFEQRMAAGVPILGTVTQPCLVQRLGPRQFRIVLTQGLNRQIRRMCEFLGVTVKRLQRVRIMNIRLDGLAPGRWRELTRQEMTVIHASLDRADQARDEHGSDAAGAPLGKTQKPAKAGHRASARSGPANTSRSGHRPGSARRDERKTREGPPGPGRGQRSSRSGAGRGSAQGNRSGRSRAATDGNRRSRGR